MRTPLSVPYQLARPDRVVHWCYRSFAENNTNIVFDISKCFILALRVAEFSYEIFFCINLCTIACFIAVCHFVRSMFVAAQEAPRGLRGAGRTAGGLLHALAKGGLSPAGESTFLEPDLLHSQ